MINLFKKQTEIKIPKFETKTWKDFTDEELLKIQKLFAHSTYGSVNFYIPSFFESEDSQCLVSVDEFDLLGLNHLLESYGTEGVRAWVYLSDEIKIENLKMSKEFQLALDEIHEFPKKFYWTKRYNHDQKNKEIGWEDFSLQELKSVIHLIESLNGFLELNMNDTFVFAASWGIAIKEQDLLPLSFAFETWGHDGAVAWASIKEDMNKPMIYSRYPDKDFKTARKIMLKNKEQWFLGEKNEG